MTCNARQTQDINLATVGADAIQYICVCGMDSCSIEFGMIEGSSGFDSGVISIRKTNTISGTPVDFTPAKNVSAAGYVELNASDWQKSSYLVIQTTTASSGAARVLATITLKKNDHTSLIDPVDVIDPFLAIPAGQVSGHYAVNKFGRNTDVDTAIEDIYDVNTSPWPQPTAARVHQITSTSTNDAALGTGTRTLRVYGLTSWSVAEVSEDITMNGTSNVATTNAYVIIHRMKVLTTGNSGEPNVGVITATADTDSTVTASIAASQGQTQMAIYGIPSTQSAYMTSWYGNANKSGGSATGGVDFQLIFNPEPDAEDLNFLIKHTTGIVYSGSTHFQHHYAPYNRFDGPGIFKVQAVGSAANNDVSAGFDIILVDN